MRIVCDNCGAKYQISDDKVRNKVFKIRCKKCSHTIVVRSKGGEAEAAAGESVEESTRVAPPPSVEAAGSGEATPDAIWYVVVNREQVGPMTSVEVERRHRAGEIDADAFTWAEGMADWIRLAAVAEFAHMFPEKESRAPARAASVAPARGGGLFPKDDGDDDVMVSNNEPPTNAPADRLFGGGDDEEPEARSPRVDAAHRLRSQRNENSVLFSLDSLGSAVEGPRVSNTGGAEGSGLIDISAMLGGGSGGSSSSAGSEAFGGPIGIAPSAPGALAGGPMPSLVRRKKSNTGLIVGIVAGAAIIAGGIVAAVILTREKPVDVPAASGPAVMVAGDQTAKSAPPASQTPVAQAALPPSAVASGTSAAAPVSVAINEPNPGTTRPAGGPARPAAAGGPRAVAAGRPAGGSHEDEPTGGPAVAAAPRTAAPPAEAAKPARKSDGGDVDDILNSLDGKGSKPTAGPGRPAAAATGGDDPLLPEQLTKPQILGVVKKAAGSISKCKERQPDATGTVMVVMKIDKSGRVGSAQAKAPFSSTPVGTCVEATVRTFQFPQFSGDSMTINMPFAL